MYKLTNRTLYGILEQNQKRTYIVCSVICVLSILTVYLSALGVS